MLRLRHLSFVIAAIVPHRGRALEARVLRDVGLPLISLLLDLIEKQALPLQALKVLVLDEADRMLDMGFQPQVDRIVDRLTADRQTMFFSATLDGEVGRLAKLYTRDAAEHEIVGKTETVDEADHRFVPVTSGDKTGALVDLLKNDDVGTTLVFVNTRRLVERVAHQLSQRLGEEAVVAHHGSLSKETRLDAESRLKGGRLKALVATASLELGIDIGTVDLVCQIGSPRSIAVALQREDIGPAVREFASKALG